MIAVLCLVFLATRMVGMHSHISHVEADEPAGQIHAHEHSDAHEERITVPEAEGATGHFDAHVHDGDIDVDSPAAASGKTAFPKVVLALIGLACILLVVVFSSTTAVRLPPRPPPNVPRRFQLLPPSQAPPCLA